MDDILNTRPTGISRTVQEGLDSVRVIACLLFSSLLFSTTIEAALDFRVIDLTHAHGMDTVLWPGGTGINFTILYRGISELGYWYEANAISTPEHAGTHLDAPSHFYKDSLRVHDIPMEDLIGPGVIIDVKSQVADDPNYRVTLDDIVAWETKFNRIPEGAIVCMNAGWSDKHPNKNLVFGSETPDDPATFNFPGWHEDTVEWLMDNRNIKVIGVDTPSTDYAKSTNFTVHQIIGGRNISGIENVANLDAVPESGSIVFVAAFKLYDGSGSQARIFATVGKEMSGDAAVNLTNRFLIGVMVMFYCFATLN